jgi:hypothetical protein
MVVVGGSIPLAPTNVEKRAPGYTPERPFFTIADDA